MKRSKFTDSQIMEALKRVDAGLVVPLLIYFKLILLIPILLLLLKSLQRIAFC